MTITRRSICPKHALYRPRGTRKTRGTYREAMNTVMVGELRSESYE